MAPQLRNAALAHSNVPNSYASAMKSSLSIFISDSKIRRLSSCSSFCTNPPNKDSRRPESVRYQSQSASQFLSQTRHMSLLENIPPSLTFRVSNLSVSRSMRCSFCVMLALRAEISSSFFASMCSAFSRASCSLRTVFNSFLLSRCTAASTSVKWSVTSFPYAFASDCDLNAEINASALTLLSEAERSDFRLCGSASLCIRRTGLAIALSLVPTGARFASPFTSTSELVANSSSEPSVCPGSIVLFPSLLSTSISGPEISLPLSETANTGKLRVMGGA